MAKKPGQSWYKPAKGAAPPRQGTFEVPPNRPCPVGASCTPIAGAQDAPSVAHPHAQRHACLRLFPPWRVFNETLLLVRLATALLPIAGSNNPLRSSHSVSSNAASCSLISIAPPVSSRTTPAAVRLLSTSRLFYPRLRRRRLTRDPDAPTPTRSRPDLGPFFRRAGPSLTPRPCRPPAP